MAANGIVYLGSRSGALYALNEVTGATVWSGNAGAPIGWAADVPFSGLAIGEGMLAVPASNRLVVYDGTGTAAPLSYTPPVASPTTPFNGTDQSVAYQVDAAHDGAQPADSLTTPLKQQWSIDFNGPASYPLIAGGKVFATVRNDAPPNTNAAGTALYALDETSGRSSWGPTDLGGGLWSGATYENGRVFAQNNDDLMRGFDAVSGNQLWAAQLPWGQDEVAPPTAAGGSLYAAGFFHNPGGGFVAGLRETDGSFAWPTVTSSYGGRGSPALWSSDLYLSTAFNAIDFNAGTGQQRWNVAGTSGLTMTVAGGRVYERGPGYTPNNIIHDAGTGQNLGSFAADPPPAFDLNRGFFTSNQTLRAMDMTTLPGVQLWSFSGDGGLITAPLVAHGVVYVGSQSGMLYGLDERTGAVLWSTNTGSPFAAPDEQNYGTPTTGMAVGEGLLVVAAGSRLIAYVGGTAPPPTCSAAIGGTAPPSNPYSAVSSQQYQLQSSDGSHWQAMDQQRLSLTISPPRDATTLVSGNADLWTANAGVNQDLGLWISGGDYGAGQLVAWKESGGYAGTFSPNAAYVQGVVTLKGPDFNTGAVTTYTIRLMWKSNRDAPGTTIFAGAGPINGQYSPTRLSAELLNLPGSNGNPWVASSATQYSLIGSNGSQWQPIDSSRLKLAITVGGSFRLLLSGNADLWTEVAGYNQDLGIFVSVNGGPEQLLAWKESGGFAGTFSPNAAAVQAVYSIGPGNTYVFSLEWKTNRPAAGVTVHSGAGSSSSGYSPTSLVAWTGSAPQGAVTAASTRQYQLFGSDGKSWQPIDDATLSRTVSTNSQIAAVLHANADLWTATAGYNQDLAIFVSINSCPAQLIGWKESGGSAGTMSPNAAYLQSVITLVPGNVYTFSLRWKANRAASSATIAVGAGPIGSQYSPTTLTVEEVAPAS